MHWYTVSGHVGRLLKLVEPWKGAENWSNWSRESALVSVLLEMKSDGHWRPRDSLNQHSEAEDWEQAGFEEVPWSLLRRGQRKHVRKGTWRFSEDISTLEARAMVFEHAKACTNTVWW